MKFVRLAHILGAFSMLASASSLALAQDAPADPLAPIAAPASTEAETPTTDGETAQVDPATTESEIGNAGQIEQARAEMSELFGVDQLAPGEFHWASDIPARGATKVVISLSDQMAFVYRDDRLIGVSTISSGKTDHETPTGVFKILGKEKVHHSKTYDNAAMPYMQRLNSYGVALHGGMNPGYPASHGCVRLPMKFAAKLFDLTQTGTPVIIEA